MGRLLFVFAIFAAIWFVFIRSNKPVGVPHFAGKYFSMNQT